MPESPSLSGSKCYGSLANMPRVQELCQKHKTILILDEIHTGFGRTGTFLAAEHWKVEPDIVCLSKG
jgi:adenosylmethionine-8-amino-7-oxononanoate aminotransferase